jgi:hypothetical protein
MPRKQAQGRAARAARVGRSEHHAQSIRQSCGERAQSRPYGIAARCTISAIPIDGICEMK